MQYEKHDMIFAPKITQSSTTNSETKFSDESDIKIANFLFVCIVLFYGHIPLQWKENSCDIGTNHNIFKAYYEQLLDLSEDE